METTELRIKALGRESGFDLVRIGPATDFHVERLRYLTWIAEGRHAGMAWITPERVEKCAAPTVVVPDAEAVISVGLAYATGLRPDAPPGHGQIARYAWGADYHSVLKERLELFASAIMSEIGGEHRCFVDTGPTMDKALAARSGLGWYGKNTNILTESYGSFVLLGEIITTLRLEPDVALQRTCGACRLCMVACPTGALDTEYNIDSRKCISYLTIEHRGPIPEQFRSLMGSWVFGCDICQDVCPPSVSPHLQTAADRRQWAASVRSILSRDARQRSRDNSDPVPETIVGDGTNPLFRAGARTSVDLVWLLTMSHDDYVAAFRGTSIKRAKDWMLRRNAAVALGNVGGPDCLPALMKTVQSDVHPVVRGHAVWAAIRIASRFTLDITNDLALASEGEEDSQVLQEIARARM